MNRHRRSTILLLGVYAILATSVAGAENREAKSEGQLNSGTELLDCLLPLPDLSGPGIAWALTVRVVPAFEPEWLVTMKRDSSGHVAAEVKVPDGFRIFSQFDRLTDGSALLTCGKARQELKVRRCEFTDTSIQALRRAADRLETQVWPAKPNPGLVFDATRYEVRLQGYMDDMQLLLQGPTDRKMAKGWHPMIGWTEELRRTLTSCEAKKQSP